MIKKLFILFVFVFSISAFGQNKEYKKTVKLFDEKKYQEVDVIADELLNEKYGKLSDEILYYTLNMSADSNNALNNYDKAIAKYEAVIDFINKGTVQLKDKNDYLSEINKHISELKSKIPSQNLEVAKINKTPSTNTDNSTTNSDKTVTLTVSGTGKTIEQAKQNALRSAIEQAFGTFISSKTEILNDNLVKEEIVSIANGNIQKFDVISEVQIPEGGFATTLKATVSVSKLTSFVESKGVVAEFKGSLFTFNIKQKIVNEKNEIKAIEDMCDVTKKIADVSFNFLIKANEPIAVNGNNEQWSIPIRIGIQPNKNFFTATNYIFNTLNALTLTKEEANDYKKLGKKIYPVSFAISEDKYDYFILRTPDSIKYLIDQVYYFNNAMINFKISNGLVDIDLKDYYKANFCIGDRQTMYSLPKDADKFELRIEDIKFRPIRMRLDGYPSLFKKYDCKNNSGANFNYKNLYGNDIEYYLHYSTDGLSGKFNFVYNLFRSAKIVDDQAGLLISFIGVTEEEELVVLNLKDNKNLDEINKITEYKISKK